MNAGVNGKPTFPHSSPAKHSSAHVVSRVNRSPYGSLHAGELPSGAAFMAAAAEDPNNGASEAEAEAGSLASYRAAMKAKRIRSASRSSNSTPYSSLKLPIVADHSLGIGINPSSKTLPPRLSNAQ